MAGGKEILLCSFPEREVVHKVKLLPQSHKEKFILKNKWIKITWISVESRLLFTVNDMSRKKSKSNSLSHAHIQIPLPIQLSLITVMG